MNKPNFGAGALSIHGLFDHQNEAVSGAINELAIADRCKILMACGTGKTRVGPALAIARGARWTVLYLPSLALIRQTLSEWIASVPQKTHVSYLCVCSDRTVAPDEATPTKDEIEAEFGVIVTTDSAAVHQFLCQPPRGMGVIFSTYQSSDVVSKGIPNDFVFDLGLFDEAHRTAGQKEGMFNAPLFDSHTPINKRVFMTATPKHYNYRKRNKNGEARVDFSMDDEAVYGRVAYSLPIRRAIEREIIVGYKVIVSVIDDKLIERKSIQAAANAEGDHDDMEQVAHAIAIRSAMQKFGARKVVTFHNTVSEAAVFAGSQAVQMELGCHTFHVNGAQNTSTRSEKLSEFAAAPSSLISNARCLIEGVDVPEIDMVAFLHPKKSRIDIIQAIGRALRRPRGSNKTTGYILLPLYVSTIENGQLEEALSRYGYDTVWQVIEALREQDEVVNQQIFEATGAKATGKPVNLDHIEVMGPAVHMDLLRASISTMCVEALGESWDEMYWILEKVWKETGNANVGVDCVINGRQIGAWSVNQRTRYITGKLQNERVERLERIGFAWSLIDEKWEENYALLTHIARKSGNSNIGKDLIVDGKAIGQWAIRQRRNYSAGQIKSDCVARLESIGFVWDPLDAQWEENFALLSRIARETGNAHVPNNLAVDGKKIGAWLHNQRKNYQDGKISQARIAKLESIGFAWSLFDEKWVENFELLSRIARETGSANIRKDLIVDGQAIGQWAGNQRNEYNEYRGRKMDSDRIAKLESIGFVWYPLDAQWEENFELLSRVVRETGSANIDDQLIVDGKKIGQWSVKQRTGRNKGQLAQTKINRLEAIGFLWDRNAAKFEQNAILLEKIIRETGNDSVINSLIVNGQDLGTWARNLRRRYKENRLNPAFIARLESIGFKWISKGI